MEKMQAFGFREHGSFEQMQLLSMHIPTLKNDEVLLKVHASALNHLDIWVRRGWSGLELALPHISGSDAAGEVVDLGAEVTQSMLGQRVLLNPGINLFEDEYTESGRHSVSPGYRIIGEHLPGTHAEYLAVPAKNLLVLPAHISYEQAAASGLVCLTAWRMLMNQAKLRCGETVLIHGAGGGVNSVSIQIAKYAGCRVIATTSTAEKAQFVCELGADLVVNYREDKAWTKEVRRFSADRGIDMVVDNVGQATLQDSIKLVKPGGRIVIVGNTSGSRVELDLRYLFAKQIQLIGSTMGNMADFRKVMALVFSGAIQPVISKVFPLSAGVEAMAMLENGQQFGKILLTPNQ